MYYLLYFLLAILVYYIVTKILGSLIKGCFSALLFLIVAFIVVSMLKSTQQTVDIFGLYQIDNFIIKKL